MRSSVSAPTVARGQRIRPRPFENVHVTGNIKVGVASVQSAYKRYSFVYDNVFGKLLEAGRKSATDIVNARAGDGAEVLEVGVGTGLSLASYRADLRVYGIDISMEMLRKASDRIGNGQVSAARLLLQMDAEKLAFRDGQFNFVVAMYVASVVPDLNALLDEVARVCRPGGEVIIVNHFKSSNRILSKIEDAIAPLYRYIGFRPNLTMDSILSDERFELKGAQPTNLFGGWCVLHLERRTIG